MRNNEFVMAETCRRLPALLAALALGCAAPDTPEETGEPPPAPQTAAQVVGNSFACGTSYDLSHVPVGIYNPTNSVFKLQNDDPGGPATLQFTFGSPIPTKTPIMGDWDGDGVDTPGLYHSWPDGTNNDFMVYLRNANSSGYADLTYRFGSEWCDHIGTCLPLAGRWKESAWNGATPALYDMRDGSFTIRATNDPANPEKLRFVFSPPGRQQSWIPLAGDWDGDGHDSFGLYDPATGTFHLAASADAQGNIQTYATFQFRPDGWRNTWQPLAGRFDFGTRASVGLYDRTTARFYLDTSPAVSFTFGQPSSGNPIAGNWSNPLGQARSELMSDPSFTATTWIGLAGGLYDEPCDPGGTCCAFMTCEPRVSPWWELVNMINLNSILDTYGIGPNDGARQVAVYLGTNAITDACDWTTPTAFCRGHILLNQPDTDFELRVFDPTHLRRKLDLFLAYKRQYPKRPVKIQVHLGTYRGIGPLADYLFNMDADRDGVTENRMRDQGGLPFVQEVSWYPAKFKHVSHHRLATAVRQYRQRNLTQAVQFLLEHLAANGALGDLIGIEGSSEVGYGDRNYPFKVMDYGVHDVAGFRTHLADVYGTIQAVNQTFGTTFSSFAEARPPYCLYAAEGLCWATNGTTYPNPEGPWNVMLGPAPNPYFDLWRAYREWVLDDFIEWEQNIIRTTWDAFIAAKGLRPIATKARVWSHQGLVYDFLGGGSDTVSRTAAGTLGGTLYSDPLLEPLQSQIRRYATTDPGFSIGEYNPLQNDPARSLAALRLFFQNGARIVTPNFWTLTYSSNVPPPGSVNVDCWTNTNPYATTTRECHNGDGTINMVGITDVRGTALDLAIMNWLNGCGSPEK